MNEMYFTVTYNYKNIPELLRDSMSKWFMAHRGDVVDIFNNYIDAVNKEWSLTGKPAAFGDYLEDINPEYIALIKNRIQPYIDNYNKKFRLFKYEMFDMDKGYNTCAYLDRIARTSSQLSDEENDKEIEC